MSYGRFTLLFCTNREKVVVPTSSSLFSNSQASNNPGLKTNEEIYGNKKTLLDTVSAEDQKSKFCLSHFSLQKWTILLLPLLKMKQE